MSDTNLCPICSDVPELCNCNYVDDVRRLQFELAASQARAERYEKALVRIEAEVMPDLSDNMTTRTIEITGAWIKLKFIAKSALDSAKKEGGV